MPRQLTADSTASADGIRAACIPTSSLRSSTAYGRVSPLGRMIAQRQISRTGAYIARWMPQEGGGRYFWGTRSPRPACTTRVPGIEYSQYHSGAGGSSGWGENSTTMANIGRERVTLSSMRAPGCIDNHLTAARSRPLSHVFVPPPAFDRISVYRV